MKNNWDLDEILWDKTVQNRAKGWEILIARNRIEWFIFTCVLVKHLSRWTIWQIWLSYTCLFSLESLSLCRKVYWFHVVRRRASAPARAQPHKPGSSAPLTGTAEVTYKDAKIDYMVIHDGFSRRSNIAHFFIFLFFLCRLRMRFLAHLALIVVLFN